MNRTPIRLIALILAALISRGIGFAEDTELRDLDLTHWSCLSKPAGTATQPDERERNRMKNRDAVSALSPELDQLDVAAFLNKVAAYDATLKATRRVDLDQPRKDQLRGFENQIVSLTGWLKDRKSTRLNSSH